MKKKKMKPKFVTVNGKKYYLDKNGKRTKGWKWIKGHCYYFIKKTGAMKTGWLTLKKKKYYLSKRGRRYHGWHTIDGKKYYFNKKTGVMAKNKKIGKYYVGKDGARQ
jgi:glucan-binding YG repeat protein